MYKPIKITKAEGLINTTYGIGVITSKGAYITGRIPPFKRIGVIAYIPTKTIFRSKEGKEFIYKIHPNMVLGIRTFRLRIANKEQDILINLDKLQCINSDILIEELNTGEFKVSILDNDIIYQPKNGWVAI